MRRREFLGLLAGATLATPMVVHAQAPPLIGFLHAGTPEENEKRLAAFRKGLNAGGFVEGQYVKIEYRWARGKNELLPELAADLVRHNVTMIATPGSTAAAVAAKKATATIRSCSLPEPIRSGSAWSRASVAPVATLPASPR